MNETEHIDLRIVKTKESIKKAFQNLIEKKSFSHITVTNIIEKAKINRSTFYKYYEDKYKLREILIKESLESFYKAIDLSFFKFDNYNDEKSYEMSKDKAIKNFNYLLKNREWYSTLWNKNMESYVYDDMQGILEKKLTKGISGNIVDSKHELFIKMFASCSMKNVQWWYAYKDQISVEEIVNINFEFFKNMYKVIWPKIN